MVDRKVSDMPLPPTVTEALEVYVNNGGNSNALTVGDLQDFIAGNLGFSGTGFTDLTVSGTLEIAGTAKLGETTTSVSEEVALDTPVITQTAGGITTTLPADPEVGTLVYIVSVAASPNTIDGNGRTIDDDPTIQLFPGESITLYYRPTLKWIVL